MDQKIFKALTILLANSLIILFWAMAGLGGDHGASDEFVYGTLIATAVLTIAAESALFMNRERVAVALGLIVPACLLLSWFVLPVIGLILNSI